MLRLEGVRKAYGSTVAVDGLSLEVRPGEVLGLLGPNGAGKSTTIHMAVGLLTPDAGTVDVGGRRLHLICIGEGQPAVIFEPSAFGNGLSSSRARTEISATTRVCSYDRMGTGWSDPGPAVISAGVLADDLDHLLSRAGIPPPYVLVPSSIGGRPSNGPWSRRRFPTCPPPRRVGCSRRFAGCMNKGSRWSFCA